MDQLHNHNEEKISWFDAMLVAEATHESFMDVRIVTAKSEFIVKARELATNILTTRGQNIHERDVDKLAAKLIQEGKVPPVNEYVCIQEEEAVVCLNRPNVSDDDVVWDVFSMIYDAISEGGSKVFGEPLSFQLSELTTAIH